MSTDLSKVEQSHGSMSSLATFDKQSLPKEVAKALAKTALSGAAGTITWAAGLGLQKATISLFSPEYIMASPTLLTMHAQVTNWQSHVMAGCILGIFFGGGYFFKQLYDQIGKKSLSPERVVVIPLLIVPPAVNQK